MKTEIKKILYRFLQDGISSDEAAQQVLNLFAVIDSFDIDATGLTPKEQLEFRMLMSTGKVKIKIVL